MRTQARVFGTRLHTTLGALLTAVLAAGLLTSCVPDAAPAASGLDVVALQRAGISVIDEESALDGPPAALTVTRLQADRMVAEAKLGAGISGATVDELAPVSEGLPPTSYLIAGWITGTKGDGARTAASLYAQDTEWTHPEALIFPTAVLAMFVSEVMAAAAKDPAPSVTPLGAGPLQDRTVAFDATVPLAPAGVCSAVTGFVSSTIQGIFSVLRVLPNVIGAIDDLGFLGKILSAILNAAIGLAQGIVEGIVSVITKPLFSIMATAITALGVASVVMTFFVNQRLVVKPSPASVLPFAIDPGDDVRGTFAATVADLSADWPPIVKDCAKVSGATLPELVSAGSPANWQVTLNATLIKPGTLNGVVAADRTAKLEFVTGRESAEAAKGEQLNGAVRVSVRIPRAEVTQFLDIAVSALEQVKADVLAKIPGPLQGAVAAVFAASIDPTIASIRSNIAGNVGGILSLQGDGSIFVTFHRPKDEDPTPPPSAEPAPSADLKGAFCGQFNAAVDVAIAEFGGASDVWLWAASFGAGLSAITAPPPAEVAGDFALTTEFYVFTGGLSIQSAGALADWHGINEIDGARVRLWQFCGANQLPG